MTETATLSEFARILEVRPSYVTKLKQAGRLVLSGKRVDVQASKALIQKTESGRHERTREHWRKNRGQPPAAGNPAGEAEPPTLPAEKHSRAYWDNREAEARAKLREIELAERERSLVETAAVQSAGTEAGTVVRSLLENLPDQLAPTLAAEAEESRVHALLTEHIEGLLTEMAARFEAIARGLTETKP